jgi:hypothetical protein
MHGRQNIPRDRLMVDHRVDGRVTGLGYMQLPADSPSLTDFHRTISTMYPSLFWTMCRDRNSGYFVSQTSMSAFALANASIK